jgi:predicted dehydrogenase
MGKIRARALTEVGGADIRLVYDPQADPSADGYVRAESPETIIADPNIEAVFICTPNYLNKPLTIAGLTAGKHVFCEKPPAFTAQDIRDVRQAEAASAKKLMYGFNHRHHGSIKTAKELVDSGQYGRLLWMRGRYGKSVDAHSIDRAARKNWRAGAFCSIRGFTCGSVSAFRGDFDWCRPLYKPYGSEIEDNVFAQFLNTRPAWRHPAFDHAAMAAYLLA